jgi:hypothetical protein
MKNIKYLISYFISAIIILQPLLGYAGYYNRANSINYAYTYAIWPYYNFTYIYFDKDCTNFVSQCVTI